MERQEKKGLREKTAELFDLPADVIAGVPKVELVGNSQVRMENHRGILNYGTEEICVSGGKYVVRIQGCGLELRAMTPTELLITGTVERLELV